MIEFRQKDFSILSDAITGAKLGAGVGTFASGVSSIFRKKTPGKEELMTVGGGLVIGAALGALWGITKDITGKINQKTTVDQRLMKTVIEQLKKAGLHEGTHFTRDPKMATTLKTKVCFVISKVSGELQLLVNIVSDPKLKNVAAEVLKKLPNTAAATTKLSDKFNDIVITSISDSSADAGLIAGVAEYFIHSGFPVYLVEVG